MIIKGAYGKILMNGLKDTFMKEYGPDSFHPDKIGTITNKRGTYFGEGAELPTLVLANGEKFIRDDGRFKFKVKQGKTIGGGDWRGFMGSHKK